METQPKTLLSRQPPNGNVRNGGLQYGELEKDAISGFGREDINLMDPDIIAKCKERSDKLKSYMHTISNEKLIYLNNHSTDNKL